jgi:tRNA 5-methylaminomethyl-2-thiouridine biosynthesis bifunctional protein
MKTQPILPATISFDQPGHQGLAWATDFKDIYHARDGAFAQAREVFLKGNGLPDRWREHEQFVIFETGFGLGNNFLATWQAWKDDATRCNRLVYLSIEKHPPSTEDLRRAHQQSPAPELASQLQAQWPLSTHGLHVLDFEDGHVRLLLAWGDVRTWWAELIARVDAYFLDGFAPGLNEDMWDAHLLKHATRMGQPDATAATWSVARTVRDGLTAAGFEVARVPGFGSKRERLEAHRRALPAVGSSRDAPPPGRQPAARCQTAVVVGGGLAGAAAAWALARQGVRVKILERNAAVARETSSNLAGLFHGVFHANDGTHAQLLRAASQRTYQLLTPWIASRRIRGLAQGLWRGESDAADPLRWEQLREAVRQQALPGGFVRPGTAEDALALTGIPTAGPGWWYGQGGWVCPGDVVQTLLETPGVELLNNRRVHSLDRVEQGTWRALDERGDIIAAADVAIIAGAFDALPLLASWADTSAWPLRRTRGQVTSMDASLARALDLPMPHHPLASGGYLIGLPQNMGGGLLCGATQQLHDEDATVRLADHFDNLSQIDKLTGRRLGPGEQLEREALLVKEYAAGPSSRLSGRTGWRLTCEDRMPLVGPLPAPASSRRMTQRQEQARFIERTPGLYMLSALGSRGITVAPLLGEVLASWITGAPVPVSASLMDAIDPARHLAKAAR